MKIKKAAVCAALAAGVLIGAAICASAADYSFDGAEAREFYPSTRYESVYGAEYNYGGMNAADYDAAALPYGCVSSVMIGAAERIILPSSVTQSNGYGIRIADTSDSMGASPMVSPVVYETAAHYVYQPTAYTGVQGMTLSDGSIGTVKIPSLGINMKVWEGETNASMAKGLGHYSASSCWDGNCCVCGHNRGAKYVIGSIKDLSIGDTVTYTTIYGTRTYSVSYVGVISNTDWSRLQATSDNRITLTTCLADHPSNRVCVQAVEVI